MRQSDKPTSTPDTYFSLWTLTDEGVRNVEKLRETIEKASGMIRKSGGTCHLYLSIGGAYDMIGVAQGVDDTTIVEIQHAIKSFGTLHTEFIKTKEFSSKDYGAHLTRIKHLRDVKR